ncbi:hypothetical protein CONCODRAFT_7198 [Conidiobolus coronatus NRRL 28638]|uniref:Uncharacterized protein n=1 Tax=Conidiobolus coronatus (strain ATCC 28846 / CBS 209.66 / NRRL 28638) TaxID=796925 RepID=A0A137P5R8_CONC2|nr:hypothetical protein CONCODRAFT_7198 [Conidiobolus coronatus NRRL 28638]|eukprot:KXN70284.1 hypothetical protein CONCODRAFT_7198 [Conidiobolus coronatus NRRL 28638]
MKTLVIDINHSGDKDETVFLATDDETNVASYNTENEPDKDTGRIHAVDLPGTMTRQLLRCGTVHKQNELIALDLIEDSRVNGYILPKFSNYYDTIGSNCTIGNYCIYLPLYSVSTPNFIADNPSTISELITTRV